MQTISLPKSSFVGGEWSPGLYSRPDLEKYSTAVRTMKNFLAHPHGGASNRPGTKFITEAKYPDKETRLISFQFSTQESYVLEFGDLYMRVIKDDSRVFNSFKKFVSIRNDLYSWELSSGGTNEYYLKLNGSNDFPSIREPNYVEENGVSIDKAALGFLSPGMWGWGDADGLGYEAIYVRLTDDADPDTKVDDFLEAFYHTATPLVDPGLKWEQSTTEPNEYYVVKSNGQNANVIDPLKVYVENNEYSRGTLGGLALNEFAFGDNDSIGFDTLYIRLGDDTDPDTHNYGHVEAAYYVEIVTPWSADEVGDLKFTQSADLLYLSHFNHPPQKIGRYDDDDWVISALNFGAKIGSPTNLSMGGTGNHYVVTAITANGQESNPSVKEAGGKGNTLTWDAVPNAAFYNVYKDENNTEFYGWIGQANNAQFFEPSTGINPDYSKSPPIARDPFPSGGNYPGVVTFHEQRLLFFRSDNEPQTFWGSVVGDYENMNDSTPIKFDDAFKFKISAAQVNEIRWAITMNDLLVGTSANEWRVRGANNSPTISPLSVDITSQSTWGSANIDPIIVGNTILFITGKGNVIRDLLYSIEVDGYTGNDLSVLSEHLLGDYTIKEWAYQQFPDSIVWCVRNDGVLLGLTYYREHQVWGWHQTITDGKFKSVTTIQTGTGSTDTYFVVEREINGVKKQFIERFVERLKVNKIYEKDVRDAFFVDSGLSWDFAFGIDSVSNTNPIVVTTSQDHGFLSGDTIDIDFITGLEVNGKVSIDGRYEVRNPSGDTFELYSDVGQPIDGTTLSAYKGEGEVRRAVTTISGLDHLEGAEVVALADGNVLKSLTVSNGSVTIPKHASRIHIGLPYECELETLEFQVKTAEGTTQDKIRNIVSVVASLQNTRELWIGPPDDSKLDEVAFRENEDYGKPTELFNGDKEVSIQREPGRIGRLRVKAYNPLPLTLTSLFARMEVGEDS